MSPSPTPIPPASELIGRIADWLEAQEDLSSEALADGPLGDALPAGQIRHLADFPARRDDVVDGLRRSALASAVVEAQEDARREREAFDALLSLVVEHATTHKGGTTHYSFVFGREHRIWVLWGAWQAGAQSVDEAREALKDVIRAALIEQTGGER